ncbi:hypothetical protein K9M47_00780 [Candidatus Gracilibacteria bacterium]|nr:hypothetical protein [Candidatus Gracilibacteria bacterium]MCF7898334.1 hypothetical protein [Candidatus Paceibacterota bacterium]
MSASLSSIKGRVVIQGFDGSEISFNDVEVDERLSYTEYHKREVFLLRYFFLLFDEDVKIVSPEQFEILEFTLPSQSNVHFFPYRIDFKSGDESFFVWIVLVADKVGKLSVFAHSAITEIDKKKLAWPLPPGEVLKMDQRNISNPNLVWVKEE